MSVRPSANYVRPRTSVPDTGIPGILHECQNSSLVTRTAAVFFFLPFDNQERKQLPRKIRAAVVLVFLSCQVYPGTCYYYCCKKIVFASSPRPGYIVQRQPRIIYSAGGKTEVVNIVLAQQHPRCDDDFVL